MISSLLAKAGPSIEITRAIQTGAPQRDYVLLSLEEGPFLILITTAKSRGSSPFASTPHSPSMILDTVFVVFTVVCVYCGV